MHANHLMNECYIDLKKNTTQLQQSFSLVQNEVVARVKISFSYAVISWKKKLEENTRAILFAAKNTTALFFTVARYEWIVLRSETTPLSVLTEISGKSWYSASADPQFKGFEFALAYARNHLRPNLSDSVCGSSSSNK